MAEENGESGESHRGMVTAKIKEVSREVVCEEIRKCSRGILQEEQIKNLQKENEDMASQIKEGFIEIKDQVKELFDSRYEKAEAETHEVKEKHKWTMEQILVIVMALASIIGPPIIELLKK